MNVISPYNGISAKDWEAKTRELIKEHPLDCHEIYTVVIQVWNEIFKSKITSFEYRLAGTGSSYWTTSKIKC